MKKEMLAFLLFLGCTPLVSALASADNNNEDTKQTDPVLNHKICDCGYNVYPTTSTTPWACIKSKPCTYNKPDCIDETYVRQVTTVWKCESCHLEHTHTYQEIETRCVAQ
ncbi:MAG: hypothetical protein ATN36_05165 [Epulopiscium sp. Nele67-Bin005]|nr:MAG: hypothetical protein ATN36_05165 [Epulopiscium sp. Nele67-Bin005]